LVDAAELGAYFPVSMKRSVHIFSLLLAGLALAPACKPSSQTEKVSFEAVDPLLLKRDLPAAEKLLASMLEQYGQQPGIVTRLARVLRADGREGEAISLLRKASESNPNSPAVWYELGLIYEDIEQYPKAKEALLKAREAGAKDQAIALLLGGVLGRMGETDAAAAEFDKALAAGGDEIQIRYNQALVQFQRKDYAGARAILEALLVKHPGHDDSRRELARVLLAEAPQDPAQVERAGSLLWDVKDKFAEDMHTWELMGDYWLLKADYVAAVASYTEALRFGKSPPHIESKYRVAEQARRDAEKAAAQQK
jgi:tetratricopeptide (TPR) repeat protein